MDLDLEKIEGFDWDSGNLEHIKRHNVDANECEEIFFNRPRILSKDETHSEVEERSQIIGTTNNGRFVFLAFTIRNNKIRVVSARDQNKREREKLKRAGGEAINN